MLLFLSAPCVSLICECVLRGAGLRDQAVMLRAALPGGAFCLSIRPSICCLAALFMQIATLGPRMLYLCGGRGN